jgi:hypothetical protein
LNTFPFLFQLVDPNEDALREKDFSTSHLLSSILQGPIKIVKCWVNQYELN